MSNAKLRKGNQNVEQLSSLDHVATDATYSQCEPLLYIFEDNEAVIHRVALEWLFDGINMEPKIEIKYVDTQNLLADMLTKGSFTRDEWCNLLRLFNIMKFSLFSRGNFRSNRQTPCRREFKKGRREKSSKKLTEPEATLVFRFGCF